MSKTPYVFYRFLIAKTNNGKQITSKEFSDMLYDNTGIEVAYRKSNPTPADYDTSWIETENFKLPDSGRDFFTCQIARHLTERKSKQYNKQSDSLYYTHIPTDEYSSCKAIFIPSIGIAAFSDQSGGDSLSAQSGASRFAAIIKKLTTYHCTISLAATTFDLEIALSNWKLENFSFTARPFNPSIRKPGDLLHDLLQGDNAQIVGHAKPNKEGPLTPSENGIIQEITGLARYGYAEYGATGQTPSGLTARIAKSKPSSDGVPQPLQIKIYVPSGQSDAEHWNHVAKAITETYAAK